MARLRTLLLTRNAAGQLLSEEIQLSASIPDMFDQFPPADRERLIAIFAQTIGQFFSTTTNVYDTRGRLMERSHQMGTLGGHRTIYRYDDSDEPVEETTEHRSREASADKDEAMHYSSDAVTIQQAYFAYQYDPRSNWTEKIVSSRYGPNAEFQPSNIERRTISYYRD